jgi:hypothetical protein
MWLVSPKKPIKDKENIPSQIMAVKNNVDRESNI